MKKTLSTLLALIMIFSCFFCVPVSAAEAAEDDSSMIEDIFNNASNMEGFKESLNNATSGFDIKEGSDINKMLADGEISGEMLGISVDFLYNSNDPLFWDIVSVSKGDIALANANLNMYLRRLLNDKYGGFNLYLMKDDAASRYATSIANFLGNMFIPDFEEVTIKFNGTETISEDEFYGAIVEASRFDDVLQYAWCNRGFDFRPVLETFGLSSENVLTSEYRDGFRLGKKLVKATISKFLSEGPVNAFLNILRVFSRSYVLYLYEPIRNLFNQKLAAGIITEEELRTLEGLLNLIFNNNNPEDTTKLQFATAPTRRFKIANDNTELFLYFIIYSNINSKHKNNSAVIESYKSSISDERVKTIIDVLLRGDLTEFVLDLSSLVQENINAAPNDILGSIKQFFAQMFKKIIDFFDMWFAILTGEKEYPRA